MFLPHRHLHILKVDAWHVCDLIEESPILDGVFLTCMERLFVDAVFLNLFSSLKLSETGRTMMKTTMYTLKV